MGDDNFSALVVNTPCTTGPISNGGSDINKLNKDFYLSEMARANEKARKVLRVQWAFLGAACVCVGLLLVFGGWWWLLAIVFAVAALVLATVQLRYVRESRKASRAFDAVDSTDSTRPES
nr:hypothetical protein [Rhodococcus wratislaviensis]GLK40693.1 hypothetical protein GCM10017611_75680 [Rhodococcus wratislaviensis]